MHALLFKSEKAIQILFCLIINIWSSLLVVQKQDLGTVLPQECDHLEENRRQRPSAGRGGVNTDRTRKPDGETAEEVIL